MQDLEEHPTHSYYEHFLRKIGSGSGINLINTMNKYSLCMGKFRTFYQTKLKRIITAKHSAFSQNMAVLSYKKLSITISIRTLIITQIN